jgi:hypothetical protein
VVRVSAFASAKIAHALLRNQSVHNVRGVLLVEGHAPVRMQSYKLGGIVVSAIEEKIRKRISRRRFFVLSASSAAADRATTLHPVPVAALVLVVDPAAAVG